VSRKVAAALFALSAITAQAAAQQATPPDLARILGSGALNDRYQAARDVLQIPPEQRDEALWVALAGELQRVASESQARTDALVAGRQVPSLGEEHSEYFAALIEAVSQWRDPRAIRPLISGGSGMLATRGIIRFGDAAVPLLIEAARTGHRSERGGVLLALQILLEGFQVEPRIPPTPLSRASREQILQLARDLLRPKPGAFRDLPTEAGLALATGDEELRQQVESLAREPGLVAQFTGVGDPNEIARLQNAIRARLDRHTR
jgi:hypothetical protein